MSLSFFLGANSAHGFYSLYDELINLKEAKAVYILKGGPGSGKSSIMKKAAFAAEERGIEVERIYCSSDPDSLDAVIFPSLKKAIVDGTSPHIVEPKYPLAVERYVNLSDFADIQEIEKKKDSIIKIKERHSECFKHVYRLTASALHIENELFDIALGGTSIEKLHKRAKGIISREINKKSNKNKTKRRFLTSISPKGIVAAYPDNTNSFTRTYVIEDDFGLGHFLLSPILASAKASGLGVIECINPLNPERLEHLIIPELSLAFITSDKFCFYNGNYFRKIRLNATIDKEVLNIQKRRISTLKKFKEALINDACSILKEAKLIHDELEELYNPYINFEALFEYSDRLIAEILK